MASIREAAQQVLDTARDGIGWIVFWKEGRGWESDDVYVDYDESGRILSVEEWELEKLKEIYEKDHNAILVNSYVHNLGVYEDWGTRDDLAAGLKWQYKLQTYLVADAIA